MKKLLFLTPLALTAMAEPSQRQPGMWETTSRITRLELIGAAPDMQARANAQAGQAQTASECLTPAQARDPTTEMHRLMAERASTTSCTFSEAQFSDGVIRIRAHCPVAAGGAAEMAIDGSFTETTIQATLSVTALGPTVPETGVTGVRISAEMTGRRTGACPAAAQPAS